ncbi:ribosomal protein L11 methyltransferase [Clostridiales Family XIII bacterium PM5-7]
MNYLTIEIDLTIGGIEPTVATLEEIGITDIVVNDPRDVADLLNKQEDYQWDFVAEEVMEQADLDPKIIIYMEDNAENQQLVETVKTAMAQLKCCEQEGAYGEGADFGTLEVSVSTGDDGLWKDKWKEYFKPTRISKSIVVKPTWEHYEKMPGDLVIEIDPGMAFGTGTHETTSMCIKMLEAYMQSKDKVLDVGCGSGILSIGAALLGASDVLGIDIDPIAVEVSTENVKLNQTEAVTTIQYGDLTKGVDYQADVIVANLMADLVMRFAKDVAKHLTSGGYFISSGILCEQMIKVCECLNREGFAIVEVVEDGEWCCIVASK